MAAMFELYDFTFSHYSEKARWALDYKGIPYTPRHLLPGFHLRITRKPRAALLCTHSQN
jgi:glutathione S-transferase